MTGLWFDDDSRSGDRIHRHQISLQFDGFGIRGYERDGHTRRDIKTGGVDGGEKIEVLVGHLISAGKEVIFYVIAGV